MTRVCVMSQVYLLSKIRSFRSVFLTASIICLSIFVCINENEYNINILKKLLKKMCTHMKFVKFIRYVNNTIYSVFSFYFLTRNLLDARVERTLAQHNNKQARKKQMRYERLNKRAKALSDPKSEPQHSRRFPWY